MVRDLITLLRLDKTFIGKLYESKIAQKVPLFKQNYLHKVMQSRLQAYGLYCLDTIYNICKANEVKVWFEFGSMLGAYREHGFIPFDFDIDIGMYEEDLTEEIIRDLYNCGFKISRLFYQVSNSDIHHKKLTEITLDYKGLKIDIFLNSIKQNKRILYVYNDSLGQDNVKKNIFGVRRFILPIADIMECRFLGITFGIPQNAKECLSYYYGEDFMTPIKNWTRKTKDLDLTYKEAYGEMVGES